MVNRLTKFIECIKKYTNSSISNIDIFNCLFMSMDDVCEIKNKNPETSGLSPSAVSKIMNGKMDIPKKYLKAAKCISPNDIAYSMDDEICRYINEEDQNRLSRDLASFIIKDDYYNNDEKNDITQCCFENDTGLLIANVFILLLRKTESEYNSNFKLTLNCYYSGKIFNSLKLQDLRSDVKNYVENKKREIESNYKKINNIHIKSDENKTISNSTLLNNKSMQISFAIDSIRKKVEIENEVKKYISTYANKYNIELVDDFYDLGLLKENTIQIPGYKTEKYGTETEKEKYDLIMKLYGNLIDYIQLLRFDNELYFSHCLKIAVNNSSSMEDNDIVIKLLFPKDSIFINYNYSFSNEDSAKLFLSLYDKYFEIKETIDFDLCCDYSTSSFIDDTPSNCCTKPLYEKQKDKSIIKANNLLKSLNEYELINDKKHDVLKIHINKIRKNVTVLLPTPILLKKDINKIEYMIESKYAISVKNYYTLKK